MIIKTEFMVIRSRQKTSAILYDGNVNNIRINENEINRVDSVKSFKGLIPRALFLGEMRIISPVSFELRPLE
jgi:hypothetical protein